MENDFCTKNMTTFKINQVEYVMFNHILKTMSLFEVLKDCEMDQMLQIKYNISPEKINVTFHIINNNDYAKINLDDKLSDHLEIIAFMKYLGIHDNVMEDVIGRMTKGSIIDYIDKCKTIPYDDNMMFFFENYHFWRFKKNENESSLISMFKYFIKKINVPHFPTDFQRKVIKKMIMISFPFPKGECKMSNMCSTVINICYFFSCGNESDRICESVYENLTMWGKKIDDSVDGEILFNAVIDLIINELIVRKKVVIP
jgi:hypothetical protein